jgi:predicted TIM-barrel fold metal-dependent hydrolase
MTFDFAKFDFASIPIIDGHIHFKAPSQTGCIHEIMAHVPMTSVNLLSTPSLEQLNDNPALIHFKAHHPQSVTLCAAPDYSEVMDGTWGEEALQVATWDRVDAAAMSETLAAQVRRYARIGFDGMKIIEGKPMVRKRIPIPLDAPHYEGLWATLEATGLPVLFHVADPEEFWDRELIHPWAFDRGWYYGDGTFPSKEALYTEVDHILARHPDLNVIFAHFYFLSADLERAAAFLDAHPNVCFDLTPGSEMYFNFAQDIEAARAFFVRYDDRLIFGTDINSERASTDDGLTRALTLVWVIRAFLEKEGAFTPPDPSFWGDRGTLYGIGLPEASLEKIYHTNFERIFGPTPASLDREAVVAELERMAVTLDKIDATNQARQVLDALPPSFTAAEAQTQP